MGEAEGGSMGNMCLVAAAAVVVWLAVGITLSAGLFIVYTPDVSVQRQ